MRPTWPALAPVWLPLLLLAHLALVGAGCKASSPPPPSRCRPGQAISCSCPSALVGHRLCNSAGSGYLGCICPDPCLSCPTPENGISTCLESRCGISCDLGYHACGDRCDPNDAIATCGDRCDPCPLPIHGAATCQAEQCGITCDPGYFGCDGQCLLCSTPAHATPICDDGSCRHLCDPGYHACGAACCPDVTQLAAGDRHTCALAQGGVLCWGDNTLGQLGNGLWIGSSTPVQVRHLEAGGGVSAIAAGRDHTCAIVDKGVLCWGGNAAGQLGDGSSKNSAFPIQVGGLSVASGVQVTAIAAGETHTCALLLDNELATQVVCWGGHLDGLRTQPFPTEVRPIAIAGGGNDACATTTQGVWCWTATQSSSLPEAHPAFPAPIQVTHLALASGRLCAVADGALRCIDADGSVFTSPGLGPSVRGITLGTNHVCAYGSSSVVCWGQNTWGQLGDGTYLPRDTPVDVRGLGPGALLTGLSASARHTCAILSGGVVCWGDGRDGQLGSGSPSTLAPQPVVGLPTGAPVATIAAGGDFACAVLGASTYCWGANSHGQLGNGTTVDAPTPSRVSGFDAAPRVLALGVAHACAVDPSGFYCWGDNTHFQAGRLTPPNLPLPLPVNVQNPSDITDLALGADHSCALLSGKVQCWGQGADGALGSLWWDDTALPLPVAMPSGTTATLITAGARHACYLSSGLARCWGDNTEGFLGFEGSSLQFLPTTVLGAGPGATTLCSGWEHACALLGTHARCWGKNDRGQLGVDTGGLPNKPTEIIDLGSGVTAIGAGRAHTCAIQANRALCWGDNTSGQLGDGTRISRTTPRLVPLPTPTSIVKGLALGADFTCATIDDRVYCWGDNSRGALGVGRASTSPRAEPVTRLGPR